MLKFIADAIQDKAVVETTKRIEKAWGTTTPLIVTPMFELHRLSIKRWHRCSFHAHQFKHNAFYVLEGKVFIDFGTDPSQPYARREHECIHAGETFTIAPGVPHQFRTNGDTCEALEMYYTEPLSEDICRFNTGGSCFDD